MKSILTLLGLLVGSLAFAQDHVKWSYAAKKISEGTYEVHITANVAAPWHLYSQSSPEDAATPTKFTFKKNPLTTLQGTPKEVGNLISKYESSFKTTVKYYEDKVTFVQLVKVKGKVKTTVAGSVDFMICNEHECIPGDTVDFTVALN